VRQIIIFVIVALVLSALRRGRGAGTGPPVARPWLRPTTTPPPGPASPAPIREPGVELGPSQKTQTGGRRTTEVWERIERARTETRRRRETEAANAAAEAAVGPRTSVPGGIDPKLLDAGRTPPPTPDPIHPR
jgi:hypothetical protein